ncbi:hypothetical protein DL240_14660 [Lujinxingia litoralis]|uniref:Sodium:proline symporter n=1 Tax=Lujinxingia litoralis TaxID=2211119 RepID=A0A328C4I9_9DELT|nr:hypothetical protein [Lujinxingia litoralis]RAL20914.1 hypothetical protein DL240_14660 [Lujinxingia litoralis]
MATQSASNAPSSGRLNTTAALWAGGIGGLLFLVLELAIVPLMGMSVWAPLQMISAIVLGSDVLPPPAAFSIGVLLTALLVHFALSFIYASILGFIIARRPMGVALGIGAIFGLALYVLNFYVFTGLYPWFAEARNALSIGVHLAFGLSAAFVYVRVRASERLGRAATA